MLDSDLAKLYGVETRALNQAVRRNADRFPGILCGAPHKILMQLGIM